MPKENWTPRELGFAEGYAAAMDDLLHILAESMSGKSYDPMAIDGDTIHSYAYDLKDGGRHHPLSDYNSVAEICGYVRRETIDLLNDARNEGWGAWHKSQDRTPLISWRDKTEMPQWRRDHYNALDS